MFQNSPDGKKNRRFFKGHLLSKENEKRFEIAPNLVYIITDPDDIWGIDNNYQDVGFFKGEMNVVTVLHEDGKVKAKTMYKVDNERSRKALRRGVLIKKK